MSRRTRGHSSTVLAAWVGAMLAACLLAPVAYADHGICVPPDVDLVLPTEVPLTVAIHVTPGNRGPFLINGNVYGVYTADVRGWIRFGITADALPLTARGPVRFTYTGDQPCPDATMTVTVGLPDTATAGRSGSRSGALPMVMALIGSAIAVTVLSVMVRSRMTRQEEESNR